MVHGQYLDTGCSYWKRDKSIAHMKLIALIPALWVAGTALVFLREGTGVSPAGSSRLFKFENGTWNYLSTLHSQATQVLSVSCICTDSCLYMNLVPEVKGTGATLWLVHRLHVRPDSGHCLLHQLQLFHPQGPAWARCWCSYPEHNLGRNSPESCPEHSR